MTLWTPGGEHEVPREPDAPPTGGRVGSDSSSAISPDAVSEGDASPDAVSADEAALAEALGIPSLDDLDEEQRAQLESAVAEMAETERQLASTPADVVVANHAMGMYELGAIHLRQNPPNLPQASLAIDALGALLDGLLGRLGDNEATLQQARTQLQQAYLAAQSTAP